MSDELPKSWTTAPLDSLCQRFRGVSYGREDASAVPTKGFVPILRANNLQNDRLTFDELVWVSSDHVSDQQKLRTGDIVIAMSSGSKSVVGKTAQVMEDWQGSFGAFCGVLRPLPELNSRYVGLFLRTREYRSTISELAAGSNINNLKNEHFAAIEVPVAPLAEQRRIVAKLETLLGKVDATQQRLAKMPILLKRFRQSVLAAACSGRLTADWRDENDRVINPSDEPKPSRSTFELSSDVEVEPLPENWRWIPIGNLSEFQQGMQIAKVTRLKEPGAGRLPILRTFNYANGFSEDVDYVEVTKDSLIAEADDIILSRTGTIGKVLTGVRGIFHNNSFRLNYDQSLLTRKYLIFWLEGPSVQNFIKAVSGRSAQPDLTHKAFGPLPFPLPTLPEQQEIVRRVEGLFALADQLEERLAKARGQLEKLTPSLLARAFAGLLVPQDPTDEPASELLKRIRAKDGLNDIMGEVWNAQEKVKASDRVPNPVLQERQRRRR